MKFTENQLKEYALPLSDTEDSKCLNAIKAIRDALIPIGYYANEEILPLESGTYAYSTVMKKEYSKEKIQIFIQGSYANNTCVRGESDVDVAVVRLDEYEVDFGAGLSPLLYRKQRQGGAFKDAVEQALKAHFPYETVKRKNKSIKVDGNTYRKNADTVPAFSMHYYRNYHAGTLSDLNEGITIYADDGQIIVNFPKQHIANGKKKNNSTKYYYKKMVRIIKKMRVIMEERGYKSASKVSSFGLESLLWNLPNEVFTKYSLYRLTFDAIVCYLHKNVDEIAGYKEVNGIKPLCPTNQMVEDYKVFINDLYGFYEWI